MKTYSINGNKPIKTLHKFKHSKLGKTLDVEQIQEVTWLIEDAFKEATEQPVYRISDENFEKVYEILEKRLNQVGKIRSGDAWILAKGTGVNYTTIVVAFRYIMTLMAEQGKAEKVKHGVWNILKPNKIQSNIEQS